MPWNNGTPGVKIPGSGDDIASEVYLIISEQLTVDIKEVTNESSFVEDLGADSLDQVELLMEFEEKFDIEISDENAEKIQTVGQAIDYISKFLEERGTQT